MFDFERVRAISKKRGRKSKEDLEFIQQYKDYLKENNIEDEILEVKKEAKKRGRKPRGGKYLISNASKNVITSVVSTPKRRNIVLHLFCKEEELINDNGFIGNTYMSTQPYQNDAVFSDDHATFNNNPNNITSNQSEMKLHPQQFISQTQTHKHPHTHNHHEQNNNNNTSKYYSEQEQRIIHTKLTDLQRMLHTNTNPDKQSSCFWCTHNFDNPPIYIPKQVINNMYEVYGCFCMPECAVAYLFNENIDPYVVWERYSLLNHIYSCIYNYKDNIKPAPSPYYILEKYYGNMTIQEYRQLIRSKNILLVVDKPLTRIMPELIEDNNKNDIRDVIQNKTNQNSSYRLSRNKPLTNHKKHIGGIQTFLASTK